MLRQPTSQAISYEHEHVHKRIVEPKAQSMKTLKASLVASVIATGAWMLGLTRAFWPAHPQLAVFFLTVAATVVLVYVWPDEEKK
jgi:hypothetical protein